MFGNPMNNPQPFTKYFKIYLLFRLKIERKKRIRFLPPNGKTGSYNTSLWENLYTVCSLYC